jgi:hypothetical protein
MSGTVLDAARREFALGHVPIPVPRGKKRPVLPEWQNSHPAEADLPALFANGSNIGVLLGEPSGGLVDIDLDWKEARVAGAYLLPQTASVFGRKGSPRSHWRYYADPLQPTTKLIDPVAPGDEAMVVEYRSTGAQTIHPPSLHPEGEVYTWEQNGVPARVDGRVLLQAVEKVAAAALLAKYWPRKGARHEAALALSGALLRAEWNREDVEEFVRAVVEAAGDEEADDRVTAVRYTEKRLADNDRQATGYTRLAELVDERVARKVKEWLGLPEERWPLRLDGRLISGPDSVVAQEEETPRRPVERPWPAPMGEAAFVGLLGETVEAMAPHTEADRHALLVNILGVYGCALNAGPHMLVGGTLHSPRLFAVLVGTTSRGKKGDSWNIVSRLFESVDADFHAACVQEGLSSGEGLISAVRDPQYGIVKGEEVMTDPGVSDKRLLVVESEFGRVLAVMKREGSTLSAVLRSAWDHGNLRVMTKSQLRATAAHICVLGHITPDELVGGLGELWIANGFANRFLWIAVRRSRPLAWPEPFDGPTLADLTGRWKAALDAGRKVGRMGWTEDGRALYEEVYPDLGSERSGIAGSLIARGAPCVLRLAMGYALIAGSSRIDVEHLNAALEVWAYSERTVDYLWGETTGNPHADVILGEMRARGEITRTDIRDLFSRNEPKHVIDAALELLLLLGKAESRRRVSGGRPTELWTPAVAE